MLKSKDEVDIIITPLIVVFIDQIDIIFINLMFAFYRARQRSNIVVLGGGCGT